MPLASGKSGRRFIAALCAAAVMAVVVWALGTPRRGNLPAAKITAAPAAAIDAMVLVRGGQFAMGSDFATSVAERPAHEVTIDSFWIDAHEVTNRQFAQFVAATGYVTTAERVGHSSVFDPLSRKWRVVAGADWRQPTGPHSSIATHDNLPVVQVSWHDAIAYAHWALKRLPTEAEWEYAARGGLSDADYPWGREELPAGCYQANYWQGWFPDKDLGRDGFRTLAPVESYPSNAYGLHDMAGNVWEWCADWFADDYYQARVSENPSGPRRGSERVQRGGSWLCAVNYSAGIKVWARGKHAPDDCHNHVGFRCARDARR